MVSKIMKKLNMTTKAGFDYGGIPPNLQKRGLFCLYRLELKTANAVKPDQVPYKQDGTRADPSNPADFSSFDEALAALVMLGFTKAQSEKALTKLFKENPGVAVEQAIKQALKMM